MELRKNCTDESDYVYSFSHYLSFSYFDMYFSQNCFRFLLIIIFNQYIILKHLFFYYFYKSR